MKIIAFDQYAHSIRDIMKSQGIPDFQVPPPIPKFIDTLETIIDENPSYDSSFFAPWRYGGTSFEPAPDEF